MNHTMLAVRIGGGEVLIILLCLIGLALAVGLMVGAVFLILRSATRGREAERRLQIVEAELRELKKRLASGSGPDLGGSPKERRASNQ